MKKKIVLKTFLTFSQKKTIFLYFEKWNFLAPSLKNIFYFRRELSNFKKLRKPTLKKFLYFRKWNFLTPSWKTHIFSKKECFLFQKGTCKARKSKDIYSEESSYISPKKFFSTLRDDCWSSRKTKNYTPEWMLIRCKIKKIIITGDDCWLSVE